jgi:hypothetical protein
MVLSGSLLMLFPPLALMMPTSFFIIFAVLLFELRAYTLSHSTSPIFVMGFFEIWSCELFAQRSSDLWLPGTLNIGVSLSSVQFHT